METLGVSVMAGKNRDQDTRDPDREAFWWGVALGALGGLAGEWWGWE